MNYQEIAERQTEIERKVDFDEFNKDVNYWNNLKRHEALHLFRISAAWKSLQLWVEEKGIEAMTPEVRNEYKSLLDDRTKYAYYVIERGDSHFSQVKMEAISA